MNNNESVNRYGPIVGAIDAGMSSTRFLVFAANTAEVLTYHQIQIPHICPKEGWFEQDALEILTAVKNCIKQTVQNMKQLRIDPADIVAIGITNQRETTILWDSVTGQPLYHAIVWMDIRTTVIIDELLKNMRNNKDYLKPLCGLPISPYFSALKIKWLIDNVPSVQEALAAKRLMFGTMDTWLIWNLTGGINGGVHVTDVSNASRTMLMNIATLKWDRTLLEFFNIPFEILPDIRSSSEIYGYIQEDLQGVPISGCLGDQQSALVGHMCFEQGQAKCTYGTGCFLLYNTGTAIVESTHGLLTTVAYQLGPQAPAVYALEGSVSMAGALMQWLLENIEIFARIKDCEVMVEEMVNGRGEIIFVPAFTGLFAPYWRKDARGVICGITDNTTDAHLVKAALQAVCFQTRDILDAMKEDTKLPLKQILVDGAMTRNNLLMQMQADVCGVPLVRPPMAESIALGAAIAAGLAEGIRKWEVKDEPIVGDIFTPSISENEREILYAQWKKAIERSYGWEMGNPRGILKNPSNPKDIHKATAPGLFVISTIILLIIAKYRSIL